ncbi:MAG: hypothetical protein IKJ99_03165 [Oscillospiraceae bacterium]|nr:hypothetical protein [Oscillospiraceae bacterium]
MPDKKIIVRAWYETGFPNNRRLRADFVGAKIRYTDKGVYLESIDAWGVLSERFHPYSNIEKIWEE